jgi:CRP-like cAMP-binding protein
MSRNHWLRTLLMRYASALFATVAQSAACNRAHGIEERMCRWLLMIHDRADGDTFPLTQEFLVHMLGVRRPTVSLTATTLQRAGLIRYSRGKMTILARAKLETTSCECYARVKR